MSSCIRSILAMTVLVNPLAAASPVLGLTPCVLSQKEVLQRSQPTVNAEFRLRQARQRAQAAHDLELRDIGPCAPMQDIANRRALLQRKTDEVNRGLAQYNANLRTAVMRQASAVIHDIALARGCGVVMPRESTLQVVEPSLDITPAVIERLGVAKPAGDSRR